MWIVFHKAVNRYFQKIPLSGRGKGANQALAVSKCNVKTHFVGKVGNDQFSQMAYEHLTSSAINSFMLYQDKDKKTGTALIYVCQGDGENMIAISPGANQSITADEVEAIIPELKTRISFNPAGKQFTRHVPGH